MTTTPAGSAPATTPPAPPRPRSRAPELTVDLVGGGRWSLSEQQPAAFTMIVFYRGLHCPVCRGQLAAIRDSADELAGLGVEPIGISAENQARAERIRDDWDLSELPLGYDLSLEAMREWGLFVSTAANDNEPAVFPEPATFLVDAEHRIYYASLTSMPFGRPQLAELLGGIDFVTSSNYPARGDS
ncbi:peroxiredoxin-like family protein [Prauserella alba]|uniref:Peroxiredoxin-like family protein n=1 Tax=Prauserella alba TaxID=176898 RepID=A0ABP4FLL8_9PSEU|nr:peroxiredoxin-like family protein [Prauserella alba]MCP2178816.1 Peroxiredoxin [Prauserella alba]